MKDLTTYIVESMDEDIDESLFTSEGDAQKLKWMTYLKYAIDHETSRPLRKSLQDQYDELKYLDADSIMDMDDKTKNNLNAGLDNYINTDSHNSYSYYEYRVKRELKGLR